MKPLDLIAGALVVVGALNWGLVGLMQFDLVAALFGMQFGDVSTLTAAVYAAVGFAGIYQAARLVQVGAAQTAPAHTN